MTKAEFVQIRREHYRAQGEDYTTATQWAADEANEMFPFGTPAAVERDLNAEATAVYQQAYSQAYSAAASWGGSDESEAVGYATAAGREAEDIFWAQIQRAMA